VTGERYGYYKYGNGKINIVLLHGWMDSSDTWHEFVEPFILDYTVILIDWRGHGNSTYNTPTVNSSDIVKDIAFLLQKLNVTEAYIGGYSAGGMLAQ
jgi:pimeloyl-ACP methyl ester carboxylesterase